MTEMTEKSQTSETQDERLKPVDLYFMLESYSWDQDSESIISDFCLKHFQAKKPFYETLDETDWVQDGKYQYRNVIYQLFIGDQTFYIEYDVSRNGSPFTDWNYNIVDVNIYEKRIKEHAISVKTTSVELYDKLVKLLKDNGEDCTIETSSSFTFK